MWSQGGQGKVKLARGQLTYTEVDSGVSILENFPVDSNVQVRLEIQALCPYSLCRVFIALSSQSSSFISSFLLSGKFGK